MKDGFIKVSAATPKVKVANTEHNYNEIYSLMQSANENRVNVLALPELCVTGYTCGDLFSFNQLIDSAKTTVEKIARSSKGMYPVFLVGFPHKHNQKLFNCAAVIFNGEILGIVPKTELPNYSEFSEMRTFESGNNLDGVTKTFIANKKVPFGTELIFKNKNLNGYTFSVELCEDLFSSTSPSDAHTENGAMMVFNLSASNETVGKAEFRRTFVKSTSLKHISAYIYANAGEGESTQDTVYSAHNIIAEYGKILAENKPFNNNVITTEIDLNKLEAERAKKTSFYSNPNSVYEVVEFDQAVINTALTRRYSKTPFVPQCEVVGNERAEEVLNIQAHGLKKRIEHTGAKVIIGISGGLDSTLALLVAVRTFDKLERSRKDILAVTMPCFGTTKRTKSNAEKLCELLGVSFKEIDITNSVKSHFNDINQSENCFDVTYENAQARERTQVLMDLANKEGALVIGTGDLSELALGWATYNGDQMSMYSVNSSVPKTLVRHLVKYVAELQNEELKKVLYDIVATPVSPELLPSDNKGDIAQKTEDLVGPYELHDFFIYHTLRFGFTPTKVFRLCKHAFGGEYDDATILHWLKVFIKRFFTQQYKRSCMPDGAKIGAISLSPRADWKMPSDASAEIWLRELEKIEG